MLILLSFLSLISLSSDTSKYPTIQKHGKTVESFVPRGWKIIAKAQGDLNDDSVKDWAIVIQSRRKVDYNYVRCDDTLYGFAPSRVLLILVGKPDSTFDLALQADHIIPPSDQGGAHDDPFHVPHALRIAKGSLFIAEKYGGACTYYAPVRQYRFQNGDWYLIGSTTTRYECGEEKYHVSEVDLLNGKAKSFKRNSEGEQPIKGSVKNIDVGKRPLVRLLDFCPWKYYEGEWT